MIIYAPKMRQGLGKKLKIKAIIKYTPKINVIIR